jgi:hypothetical protein
MKTTDFVTSGTELGWMRSMTDWGYMLTGTTGTFNLCVVREQRKKDSIYLYGV